MTPSRTDGTICHGRRSRQHMSSPAVVVALALSLALPVAAHAQGESGPTAPIAAESSETGCNANGWSGNTLLGDIGGARSLLCNYGITIGLMETSELLGNVTGGTHTGFAYDGQTLVSLGLDTQKLGLDGGIFNVSALQIHGRNLSTDNLQTLQTASGIQAQRTTRLWELWYQQSFLNGRFDVKVGQQSIDLEFLTSAGSGVFINTAMGWPILPSVDLYAGGPAYPLSSLGIRFRANQLGPFSILAGVFDDNPPGGPFNDDGQLRGAARSGTRFNLGTGALFIAEVQYAFNQPDADRPGGLAGTYKLGAWYDTASFPDQRFDTAGVPLASPLSNGNPALRRNNYSLYGVADQAIWSANDDGFRTVSVFARLMGAPGDRNLVSFSANAGITVKAPLAGRDKDAFGIGWGIAKVSPNASRFDRDINALQGYSPIRNNENFIEVTYQYQATDWLLIQPDFQYVFMPGAGTVNPLNPTRRIENEAVFGARTYIVF